MRRFTAWNVCVCTSTTVSYVATPLHMVLHQVSSRSTQQLQQSVAGLQARARDHAVALSAAEDEVQRIPAAQAGGARASRRRRVV